ncbi:MAG: hypothetical protein C4519_12800 [Desulfobacteraceae bacterium]|nr:MAG: hypothetical protein C4519_12800 [Desulfobacteraceae bacterium]
MGKRAIVHVFVAIFFIVAAGCAAMGTARHAYIMKGQILEVDGREAYLCIGSTDGARAGQEFPVYRYVKSQILGETKTRLSPGTCGRGEDHASG